MADHQPDKDERQQTEFTGGWGQPRPLGRVTVPEPVPAAPADTGGWRVPAMPENLEPVPASAGDWHLPSPEQTPFKPEDMIEISAARAPHAGLPPEDMLLAPEQAPAEAAPAPAAPTDLDSVAGLGDLIAMVSMVQPPPPPRTILTGGEAEADTTSLVGAAERAALEREALEADEAGAPSAADFAREQLDALQADEAAAPIPVEVGAVDPAAFAREQLDALLDDTQAGDFTPVEAAPAVDVEREALAHKFLETETQVRALREQYQTGAISREELQDRLRKMLVLDDAQNWWMMGVDTDAWFRFDAVRNEWVQDTPPQPSAPARREGALPYLTDEPARDPYYATGADDSLRLGDESMPLPRQVPVTDPDYTVPNMGAINMDTVPTSEALTLEGTRPYTPGVTQPAYAVGAGEAAVPAPGAYTGVPAITFEEAAEAQRRDNQRRLLLIAALVIGLAFILGALFLVVAIVLPYNNIANQYRDRIAELGTAAPRFQTGFIYDRNGDVIATRDSPEGAATPVTLSKISPEMVYATVGVLDPNYYETAGFDPLTIVGAFLGGGSLTQETITQRVARLLVLDEAVPTAQNRLTEFVVASEIARRYDKNQILEMFLNNAFFGNQTYGVEAAANFYFSQRSENIVRRALDINLVEAAMLVGLIQDPAGNDPVINLERSIAARDANLQTLTAVGCLNFQHTAQPFCVDPNNIFRPNGDFADAIIVQASVNKVGPYLPRRAQQSLRYPHFANFVEQQIDAIYGAGALYRLGLRVTTTLDPRIQDAAQAALVEQLRAMPLTGVNTGAIMVTEPASGAILAMIGSPDFSNAQIQGQINGALTWQQPGQAIFPVIYTAALENVGDRNQNGQLDYEEYMTAATLLWNVPTVYQNPSFTPTNNPAVASGPVALRHALAQTINIPAVKAYEFIGNDIFVNTSRRMGLTFRTEPPQVSLLSALGTTEVMLYDMMGAYGTLANTGTYAPLFTIASIVDASGQTITPPRPQAPAGTGVNAQAAFLIQNILSDNTARAPRYGSNSALLLPQFGDRVAVTVGSSEGSKDLWALGFARNIAVGVWLGHPDDVNTQGDAVAHAAPVWNRVMREALAAVGQPQPFQTTDIISAAICTTTGTLTFAGCPAQRTELFNVRQPAPPPERGPVVQVSVDTWTGLRADPTFCNDSVETRTFVNISDNAALGWLRTPEGQQTAALLGLPPNPQPPPTAACDVNTTRPNVRITQPVDNQTVEGTVSVIGFATGTDLASYQLELIPASSPGQIFIVAGPFTNQVPTESVLAQFNTAQFPSGQQYTLRLNARSTVGGFILRDTRIIINNPTPTPPPTATQPPVAATNTTLPFLTPTLQALPPIAGPSFGETPITGPSFQEQPPPLLATPLPGAGAQGAPTPTIFISGG